MICFTSSLARVHLFSPCQTPPPPCSPTSRVAPLASYPVPPPMPPPVPPPVPPPLPPPMPTPVPPPMPPPMPPPLVGCFDAPCLLHRKPTRLAKNLNEFWPQIRILYSKAENVISDGRIRHESAPGQSSSIGLQPNHRHSTEARLPSGVYEMLNPSPTATIVCLPSFHAWATTRNR